MSIQLIKDAVESFAPAGNAESWDNTGILIDSVRPSESKKILLAIDLTEEVLQEALDLDVGYILAYHPVIFRPIKAIDDARYIRCIQANIAVYSPHTQLDGLMNEYIQRFLGPNPGTLGEIAEKLHHLCGARAFRIVSGNADTSFENNGDIRIGVGAAFRGVSHHGGLIITGEMAHHDMLACRRFGTSVILMEHSVSERPFLSELRNLMCQTGKLDDYEILISEKDQDPVGFIVFK